MNLSSRSFCFRGCTISTLRRRDVKHLWKLDLRLQGGFENTLLEQTLDGVALVVDIILSNQVANFGLGLVDLDQLANLLIRPNMCVFSFEYIFEGEIYRPLVRSNSRHHAAVTGLGHETDGHPLGTHSTLKHALRGNSWRFLLSNTLRLKQIQAQYALLSSGPAG